ncbi:MAG: phosphoribosyltransferase family protein [Bacteroidetes bacterium]|jgi:hypothetical protein|nr:phosphoribosyltransferase family protein [Bacteroidota bacterium]
MQFLRQARYTLDQQESPWGQPDFPADLYSRYKYGHAESARLLGKALAEMAIQENPSYVAKEELWISASAYKAVPTAAQLLLYTVVNQLNRWRKSQNINQLSVFSLHRRTIFPQDYGALEEAGRQAIMRENQLYTSTKLSDKAVLIIDDMRVTGAHEACVANFLEQQGVRSLLKLYVAESQLADPKLEDQLNHSWMNSPDRFAQLMMETNWLPNARCCKYLLTKPKPAELQMLRKLGGPEKWRIVVQAIEADGYDRLSDYAPQAHFIKGLLSAQVHHEHTNI